MLKTLFCMKLIGVANKSSDEVRPSQARPGQGEASRGEASRVESSRVAWSFAKPELKLKCSWSCDGEWQTRFCHKIISLCQREWKQSYGKRYATTLAASQRRVWAIRPDTGESGETLSQFVAKLFDQMCSQNAINTLSWNFIAHSCPPSLACTCMYEYVPPALHSQLAIFHSNP